LSFVNEKRARAGYRIGISATASGQTKRFFASCHCIQTISWPICRAVAGSIRNRPKNVVHLSGRPLNHGVWCPPRMLMKQVSY
jgi:hypothetical protein